MKKIVNKLEGIWSKQYDPTAFAIDGSVEYAFDGNNNYQFHTYNALGGESSHDYSGRYAIDMFNREPLPLTGLQQYHLYARQVDVEGDGLAEGSTTYSVGRGGQTIGTS